MTAAITDIRTARIRRLQAHGPVWLRAELRRLLDHCPVCDRALRDHTDGELDDCASRCEGD